MRLLAASSSALVLSACGLLDASGTPTRGAWRAGLGHWPANSQAGVEGCLQQGYPAIEVDIFLASDRVPVLSHEVVLDPERCTWASGATLDELLFIYQLSSAELASNYLCGGLGDPDHPDAEKTAQPLLDMTEFLSLIETDPALEVHLDARWEPGLSHASEVYAAEILERWWAADLPNPFTVSASLPEMVMALEERGDQAGRPVTTFLTWPRVPAGVDPRAAKLRPDFGWDDDPDRRWRQKGGAGHHLHR